MSIIIAVLVAGGVVSTLFGVRTELEKGLFLYAFLSAAFFGGAMYLLLEEIERWVVKL